MTTPKQPTKSEEKIVDTGVTIAMNPPSGEDLAFTHVVLSQVGLPRSKVEGSDFMRKLGDAWINVQSGYLDEGKGPVKQPIPYGSMPRLCLAWITTHAIRHKTHEIPIGESAAEFLRLMGMDDQGNRYTTLRKQMQALAACRLQIGYKGRTYSGQPITQFDAWINTRDAAQRALWPGVMILSSEYYESIQESRVPLDNRALLALKGSSLALDIYTWLAHRLYRVRNKNEKVLHWASLREQFAQEYTGKNADKDFKKAFVSALKKVLVVYPLANVEQVTGGLLLKNSPPPIPFKGG